RAAQSSSSTKSSRAKKTAPAKKDVASEKSEPRIYELRNRKLTKSLTEVETIPKVSATVAARRSAQSSPSKGASLNAVANKAGQSVKKLLQRTSADYKAPLEPASKAKPGPKAKAALKTTTKTAPKAKATSKSAAKAKAAIKATIKMAPKTKATSKAAPKAKAATKRETKDIVKAKRTSAPRPRTSQGSPSGHTSAPRPCTSQGSSSSHTSAPRPCISQELYSRFEFNQAILSKLMIKRKILPEDDLGGKVDTTERVMGMYMPTDLDLNLPQALFQEVHPGLPKTSRAPELKLNYADLNSSFGLKLPENVKTVINTGQLVVLKAICEADEAALAAAYTADSELELDVFSLLRLRRMISEIHRSISGKVGDCLTRRELTLRRRLKRRIVRLAISMGFIKREDFTKPRLLREQRDLSVHLGPIITDHAKTQLDLDKLYLHIKGERVVKDPQPDGLVETQGLSQLVASLSPPRAHMELDDDTYHTILSGLTDEILEEKLRHLQCLNGGSVQLTQSGLLTMSFHPTTDTLLVAAGSTSGELVIWNAGTKDPTVGANSEVYSFQPHSKDISGLRFLPANPSKLVTASHDGSIRILDMEAMQLTSSLVQPNLKIRCMDVSNHETTLVYYATATGELGIHDARTSGDRQPDRLFNLYGKNIWSLAVNPSVPFFIATACSNRLIELWDLRHIKGSSPCSVFSSELGAAVTSVQWNSFGNLLVCGSFDSYMPIFDVTKAIQHDLTKVDFLPQCARIEHNCPSIQPLYRMKPQFHPDPTIGFRICSAASIGKTINFYSAKTGRQVYKYMSTLEGVPTVKAYHPSASLNGDSPVGSALAVGDASGRAFILV
ncbi:hypothetical protein L0F63_005281, partial [Massospora cicadina]